MIDGGSLEVTLDRGEGGLSVRIDAPPMLSLTRMLAGKPVNEAGRLAGVVFSGAPLCEQLATDAASGLPVTPRSLHQLALEVLHHHAIRFASAWPAAIGLPQMVPPRVAAADAALDLAGLSRALFGPDGPPRRLSEFESWIAAGAVPAARVFRHIWCHWDGRWGRAELPLWAPGMPLGHLDWTEATIDGLPVETGLPARVADSNLMREIEARRGRGIIWRLAARVVDATELLDRLGQGCDDSLAQGLSPDTGCALAPNGTLLVRLEIQGGTVARYLRLSPTDFALHPRGLMKRVLATLPVRERAPLRAVAALAIESVDPFMPTRLTAPELQAA